MLVMTKRKPYPTDLTDEQWATLKPRLPPEQPRGAPRTVDLREILNALLYLAHTGCQWRFLPHDFPPWQTVYDYFQHWRDDGTWERLNRELRIEVRQAAGKDGEPSAAILDSQSIKSTETSGARGFDAGKLIKGVKRHVLVDTLGMLLCIVVLTANVQDRDGARVVLQALFERIKRSKYSRWCRLKLIWADGGYRGELLAWVKQNLGWTLEIVEKLGDQVGFQVLPKRWIVERTFAWLNRQRRLSKDYERLPATSAAFIYVAMIRLMVKRLAH